MMTEFKIKKNKNRMFNRKEHVNKRQVQAHIKSE